MLCVLPMLWAALLFSEAGGEVGTCCLPAVSPAVKEAKGQGTKSLTSTFPRLPARAEANRAGLTQKVAGCAGVRLLFFQPLAWPREKGFPRGLTGSVSDSDPDRGHRVLRISVLRTFEESTTMCPYSPAPVLRNQPISSHREVCRVRPLHCSKKDLPLWGSFSESTCSNFGWGGLVLPEL